MSFNAAKKENAVAVDWKLKTAVTTIPAKATWFVLRENAQNAVMQVIHVVMGSAMPNASTVVRMENATYAFCRVTQRNVKWDVFREVKSIYCLAQGKKSTKNRKEGRESPIP